MKTKEEILTNLPQFSGTETWHPFSRLFRNFILTDGAKYVAEACDAYGLMDMIASYYARYRNFEYVVACLKVKNDSGRFILENGDGGRVATQVISYTDFPLDEITLFAARSDKHWVILLPSEY
jgi:hypothetical protein